MKSIASRRGHLKMCRLTAIFTLCCFSATLFAQSLPPKKSEASKEEALGQSEAVQEVNRLTQDSETSSSTSAAIAPISVEGEEEGEQKQAKDDINFYKKDQAGVKEAAPEEVVDSAKPQSRYWLLLKERPEFGITSGWVFAHKELSNLAGDGYSFGLLVAQEINPRLQVQIRLGASHHREDDSFKENTLWIMPIEVLAQFTRQVGPVNLYVQPGLGGAYWNSRSQRVVDAYKETASGFDFLATVGAGAFYRFPEHDLKVGADYSLTYVSGNFDNYFSRVLAYATLKF